MDDHIQHEEGGHRGAFFVEQDGRRVAEMTYSFQIGKKLKIRIFLEKKLRQMLRLMAISSQLEGILLFAERLREVSMLQVAICLLMQ